MNEGRVSFVEVARVQQVLERILGGSLRSVTPDAIGEMLGPVDWKPVEGWDSQSDSIVASTAGLFSAGFSSRLLVVTDVSFYPGRGAFSVASEDLPSFVSTYSVRYGESFFDGDAIVVEELGKRVWIFHHEGVCACVTVQ